MPPAGFPTSRQWPQPGLPQRSVSQHKALLSVLTVIALLTVAIAVVGVVAKLRAPSYVNESYQAPPANLSPPPLPEVNSEEEAEDLLRNNALYRQAIPHPTRCPVRSIDPTEAPAKLATHLNDLVACLMRVWEQPVTAAGYRLPRPPVSVYSKPSSSACGKLPMKNAVYCSADQRIYYATDLPDVLPPKLRTARFMVETVIAHEFGHTVQARTGLLVSGRGLQTRATDKPSANRYSRRLETQADCFAGLFLASIGFSGSMTSQERETVIALSEAIGDDNLSGKPNIDSGHGLGRSRRYWTQMGLASTNATACNTWVAPDHLVR